MVRCVRAGSKRWCDARCVRAGSKFDGLEESGVEGGRAGGFALGVVPVRV